MQNRARSSSKGLTLLELLMVVLILSVTAMVVISNLGTTERESRLAVASSNIVDIDRSIQAYNALTKGKYGDGWDSLLTTTSPRAIYTGDGTVNNLGVSTTWLTATTITSTGFSALRRVTSNVVSTGPTGSLVTVYDHDPAVTSANSSTDATTARTLDTTTNADIAIVNPASTGGQTVYASFGLNPADATYRIVAFGIGPHCSLIGDRRAGFTEVPVADDVTPNNAQSYRRFVALFKVYVSSTGVNTFPQFIGVTTSYGKNQAALRKFMDS